MVSYFVSIIYIIVYMVVSYVIGAIFCMCGKSKKQISLYYVVGNITMWAVFQLLAVPLIHYQMSLTFLTVLWCVFISFILIYGLMHKEVKLFLFAPLKNFVREIKGSRGSQKFLFVIMFLVVLLQMILYLLLQHIDVDDARFVANAVAAWDSDKMLLTHPNTGSILETQVGELRKDAVSPWMMMVAMFSKLSMIHPAVMAHTALPLLLLLMVYCVIWLLAEELLDGTINYCCMFVLLASFFHIFAGVSLFHQVTFIMTRIWQGKAVVAGVVLPIILYCMLQIEEQIDRFWTMTLLGINLAACCMSGMGLILSAFMEGCFLLSLAFRKKKISYLLCGVIICIPNLIYGIMYMGSKMVN